MKEVQEEGLARAKAPKAGIWASFKNSFKRDHFYWDECDHKEPVVSWDSLIGIFQAKWPAKGEDPKHSANTTAENEHFQIS